MSTEKNHPDSRTEPVWVRVVLWCLPVPIFAWLAVGFAMFVSAFAWYFAKATPSAVGQTVCGLFAVIAVAISLANIVRQLKTNSDTVLDRYRNSKTRSTVAVFALLFSAYAFALLIALRTGILRRVLGINPNGFKSWMIAGLAIASALYFKLYGRTAMQHHAAQEDKSVSLSGGQAVAVVIFCVLLGTLFAWLKMN